MNLTALKINLVFKHLLINKNNLYLKFKRDILENLIINEN